MYIKEHQKSKTAAKTITSNAQVLKRAVLSTLKEASNLVGSTLGPNGKIVLIERQENLPPFLTKDGITVFNSMTFADPTKQQILEQARDASSKTNVDAGDNTTSQTILAEALVRLGFDYLEKNPRESTQVVMRSLEQAYRDVVIPFIKQNAKKITLENSDDFLKKVAMVATNHDEAMSDAVIDGFNIVGHGGNFTILEQPGVDGFEVEQIEGFPIARGFEDTCGRFIEQFINDRANYRTVLEKPKFLIYNGKLNDMNPLMPILEKVANASAPKEQGGIGFSENLIIVAHHFSESVLATLANNFVQPGTIKAIPLKAPITSQANSHYHFLVDLSHFVGAKVFDPLSAPLETATLSHLGLDSMQTFEYMRYRSTIIGRPDEMLVLARAEELYKQKAAAESILDAELTAERCAVLTGGIAKLKIFGSSEAELKEKKHRVEDAVMAIKGAIKDGVLPGGQKTLLTLSKIILSDSSLHPSVRSIMGRAFLTPFWRLFENARIPEEEILDIKRNVMDGDFYKTYDALSHVYGDAVELGVLDSAQAVNMSIKNSLQVSKMLIQLSGIVVFKRDGDLDRNEANSIYAENQAMADAIEQSNREQWEPPS